ncbi:hypothetical protein SASPL_150300 [Salvia splendens]|uniref:Uncharacterized protein n=1 Tax=Salvia splendens TaxID=180675 RepID=A0A8X8W6L8_SALSN|nr:hypothetical protein SASPL_150300 [Salvia splendens]
MKFFALCLVLTSLATAQSPNPREEDVIVKEGRRVVVVEYEKDDGNTKVLISPQDKPDENISDNLVKKVKEASSSVVDEMGDLVGKIQDGENVQSKFWPRELVCDACGKYKHKLALAFAKTAEAAEEVKEKFLEGGGEGEGAYDGVCGGVWDVRVDDVCIELRAGGGGAEKAVCGGAEQDVSCVFQGDGVLCGDGFVGAFGEAGEGAVLQGMNLKHLAALGMILVNLMWLEPQATKVMLEKMNKDKEEGAGKEAHVVWSNQSGRPATLLLRHQAEARLVQKLRLGLK